MLISYNWTEYLCSMLTQIKKFIYFQQLDLENIHTQVDIENASANTLRSMHEHKNAKYNYGDHENESETYDNGDGDSINDEHIHSTTDDDDVTIDDRHIPDDVSNSVRPTDDHLTMKDIDLDENDKILLLDKNYELPQCEMISQYRDEIITMDSSETSKTDDDEDDGDDHSSERSISFDNESEDEEDFTESLNLTLNHNVKRWWGKYQSSGDGGDSFWLSLHSRIRNMFSGNSQISIQKRQSNQNYYGNLNISLNSV